MRSRNVFFGGVKLTISDFKDSLTSETVEPLERLQSWFRMGIFIKKDTRAIAMKGEATEALDAFE